MEADAAAAESSSRRKLQEIDESMTLEEIRALLNSANAENDAAIAEKEAAKEEAAAQKLKSEEAEAAVATAYTTKPVIEGAVSLD